MPMAYYRRHSKNHLKRYEDTDKNNKSGKRKSRKSRTAQNSGLKQTKI